MDKVKHKDCYFKRKKKGKFTMVDWIWEAGFHGWKEIYGVRFISTSKKK